MKRQPNHRTYPDTNCRNAGLQVDALMNAYLDVYDAEPIHRIELIRARVKQSRIRNLAKSLGVAESTLVADLGIRLGSGERFGQAPSERVIGLMSLIGRVEAMVARHGATGFNAAKWLGTWLNSPLPALGGVRPGSYLDTMTGQYLLNELIAMTESGAYA